MTTSTSLPLQADDARASWYRLLLLTAMVATFVSLVTAALITVDFVRDRLESPLTAANVVASEQAPRHAPALLVELKDLHVRLKADPENEALKKQIREIDLTLRQTHFQRRGRIAINSYVLLASLAVLVISLKASTLVAKNPAAMVAVFPPPQDFWKAASAARWPIMAVSGVLIVGLAAAAWNGPRAGGFLTEVVKAPSAGGAASEPAQVTVATLPGGPTDPGAPLAELLANWPSFRGPTGSGVSGDTAPPTSWDGAKKKNILWKAAVALGGNNSPIVWNNRVFCSGGSVDAQAVYCFDADTGALVWQAAVTGPVEGSSLTLNDDTSFAASTMATDGRRVYAIFPTGDVAAFDFAGKQAWSKNLGKPDNLYGHASSLAVCQGRLIIQFDQGDKAEAKKSCLLALDGATGKELWKTPRAVIRSWASPIVIYPENVGGGPQIIAASKPVVAAYEPKEGKELYSAVMVEGDADVAPSPVVSGGKLFVVTDQSPLMALPINGHGDITKSAIWTAADAVSDDIASPLATPEIVTVVSGLGHVTAYDPASGKILWEHEFEDKVVASPIAANKRIYLVDQTGVTHIFDSAAAFHELPSCPLGEAVTTTPAFGHNRIYIRAKSNLYCIGTK